MVEGDLIFENINGHYRTKDINTDPVAILKNQPKRSSLKKSIYQETNGSADKEILFPFQITTIPVVTYPIIHLTTLI